MKSLTILAAVLGLLFVSCAHKEDLPPGFLLSDLELTDGFCLVSGGKVVLNHQDIECYDYSAHLIYLQDHASFIILPMACPYGMSRGNPIPIILPPCSPIPGIPGIRTGCL